MQSKAIAVRRRVDTNTITMELKCLQINLHHSKSATGIFCQRFKSEGLDVGLIQEPWIHKGKICGLGGVGDLYWDKSNNRARTCIIVKRGLQCLYLTGLSSGDLTVIKLSDGAGNERKTLMISSAYLPYDSEEPPPSKEVSDLYSYSLARGLDLIMGVDSNAHHTVWCSTGVNQRGEHLLNYLISTSLQILNKGGLHTFCTAAREETIDLTLASLNICDRIKRWHVSDEPSLSDHRHIRFDVDTAVTMSEPYRNPRNTKWDLYVKDLGMGLERVERRVASVLDVELAVDDMQHAILDAYHRNCRIKEESAPGQVAWWNNSLCRLRSKTRRLFNQAKRTGNWMSYRESLTLYNKEIRKTKRKSWKSFCDSIEEVSTGSRLYKVMSKDGTRGVGCIRISDGGFTDTGESTIKEMMKVHFPGSAIEEPGCRDNTIERARVAGRAEWEIAKDIVSPGKVEWAVSTFDPFKSPGPDGICPALLQKGIELLRPILCKIFRACIALKYIPESWRQVRVTFIPKPGKDDYTEAKAYRPISLSSFLLKTLERLVDRYLRDGIMVASPLHRKQHAYQTGKSTETALHNVVLRIERALENKDLALGAFIDIEGAFDQTSFEAIYSAGLRRGVNRTVLEWIDSLLRGRTVTSTLMREKVVIKVGKGCPQGGVLSPLLWNWVVDGLVEELNRSGYPTEGYADDIAIIITGKDGTTVSELMQTALDTILTWCDNKGLNINPNKISMVPFTRRRKVDGLKGCTIRDVSIGMAREVKYLGVTLDAKLNWSSHVERVIGKAYKAFWTCRGLVGKKWGISPKVYLWIYKTVVRPAMAYAALVWWPRCNLKTTVTKLSKVQRLACVGITGALRTTPTAALENLLGLPPLHIFIKNEARKACYRLRCNNKWGNTVKFGHSRVAEDIVSEILLMPSDKMERKYHFGRNFNVVIKGRDAWKGDNKPDNVQGLVWYTDGSRLDHRSGAGIFNRVEGKEVAVSLGSHATVFQAEIYGIMTPVIECAREDVRGEKIYIFSDSQAALKSLASCTFESKLVWQCYSELVVLAEHNEVQIEWIPGHCGLRGNEKADELARAGALMPYSGPEPCLGVAYGTVKGKFNRALVTEHEVLWRKTEGLRQAKDFLKGEPGCRSRELLRFGRGKVRALTGILTGHGPFRKHLSVMGRCEDATCRKCGLEDETASHIICRCDALARVRQQILGKDFLRPEELDGVPLGDIYELYVRAGPLDY